MAALLPFEVMDALPIGRRRRNREVHGPPRESGRRWHRGGQRLEGGGSRAEFPAAELAQRRSVPAFDFLMLGGEFLLPRQRLEDAHRRLPADDAQMIDLAEDDGRAAG